MAEEDPKRKLLLLIRDFAAEKSQGERRVSDLKKRFLDRQAHFETASNELEKAKRAREAAEGELRGSQAQLDRTCASLRAQEERISGLQGEISNATSELQAIKKDGDIRRDEFIRAMQQLNVKIRKFHERAFQALKACNAEVQTDMSIETANSDQTPKLENENNLKDLESEILSINAEIHGLEEECQQALHDVNAVHDEVARLERKVSLGEAIMLESERLKQLLGYPFNILRFLCLVLT
ncbi:hypothetical protein HPP92_010294 [Vanilla planifolia]|uniref:Uncharacterized protein n=1 Tax=Vanilla planifolia TaxID=51239 RepID=A0A835QYP8_VANPL|nr:hypothetical protein HPP92_010294 [Vanilla planifolia]